jgi:hypothetical protein
LKNIFTTANGLCTQNQNYSPAVALDDISGCIKYAPAKKHTAPVKV